MSKLLNENINLGVTIKTYPTKGNLVYEYNPFRNYRLDLDMIYYKDKFWTYLDFLDEFYPNWCTNITSLDDPATIIINYTEECAKLFLENYFKNKETDWYDLGLSKEYATPVPYQKGLLVDFDTDELSFDLHHPVSIIPKYSYDNSVDLIINDGKNKPRLINSRFSATERNKYQIVDRKGNNDANIYDQGGEFDIDTSLYKISNKIPILTFKGVEYGGQVKIGNYHFYFKFVDDDENESDFVAESGLVSIFIGNTPLSIYTGFRDENSLKLVKFELSNIDISYKKVKVYYSRATSDINENYVVNAFMIESEYIVDNNQTCNVLFTGYEQVEEIPVSDLNLQYLIYGSVETLTEVLNRLFFGNVKNSEIPYEDLADISLRFLPTLLYSEYNLSIDLNYNISGYNKGYYDPKFIYNKLGYFEDELYRFGIVYIFNDNTLSPVFNVRGTTQVYSDINNYTKHDFKDSNGIRNYIKYSDDDWTIASDDNKENVKGVIKIHQEEDSKCKNPIIGINFSISDEILQYLLDVLKVRGFFFVRQKRIPTILCQAYTIGIDKEGNIPLIPTADKYIAESFLSLDDRLLTNSFNKRKIELSNIDGVRIEGAICPEYDINSPYLNTIFSGGDFKVRLSKYGPQSKFTLDEVHFYVNQSNYTNQANYGIYYDTKILGVEDNTKLVSINTNKFSARAGEAEEAFRYACVKERLLSTESTKLVRGSFGPYLGIVGYPESGNLIDIMIPGYLESQLNNYLKIRYEDKSSYYAISDRIDLNNKDYYFTSIITENNTESILNLSSPLYRGDCYICQFTHRVNRNFQDPSAPINDQIVDPECWKDNFEYKDGVVVYDNFEKINLGDVNAILLGMWVTFTVRSSFNLNVRSIDDSIVDELSLTGNYRSFYPKTPMLPDGSYKIPEALCYNKGFQVGLSQKWNFELPDVPSLKNDFSNRIAYSDIKISDAFKNGFRTFPGLNYRDYPKTYGSITKLIELSGNILCVFEHGVALIPVNERTLAGNSQGGDVFINTSNILPENPKIISNTFGSQWKESIIKTSNAVYGVDTIGKKIWRTNGQTFECISDLRVLEFLNQNISLTERELEPVIGIRNVKTHYNKFKGDVMFTFYDNLYGFEEKVWNLCWNETLNTWVTFYSWVPSYSENIYNQYFSFDRNTSKWIAKLGVSNFYSLFSDGITLENNIIENNNFKTKLHLSNREIPNGATIRYSLERDNYENYKYFTITNDELCFNIKYNYENLCSELFVREHITYDENGNKIVNLIDNPNDSSQNEIWKLSIKSPLPIHKDDRGRRINLVNGEDKDDRINGNKIVILLNIKAEITKSSESDTIDDAYLSGFKNTTEIDYGYYQSTVALIPKYNLLFLTTDFWKHGLAGIIDIADKIYPTYWYGKLHPFEFEFVVADNPTVHKIFNNLEIISNNAAPESFHYEIIGDCYDFAKDKKNMYIRQEATKELYQYNGSDIVFDHNYSNLKSEHRPLNDKEFKVELFDKSTIFPCYYVKQDTINEIEDAYHSFNTKDSTSNSSQNFSALSGAEIIRYENLNEYRICNHAKAVDISKDGILRGNMYYKEDIWDVQINPINFVQKTESKEDWENKYKLNASDPITYDQIPAELNLFKLEDKTIPIGRPTELKELELPENWTRNIVSWDLLNIINKESNLKDKFIKIKIRYSGKDLAIISAIKTLYAISYA